MDDERLPVGMSIVETLGLENATWFRATCVCDWRAGRAKDTRTEAMADAVQHARHNAWCYVHRNLTPVGVDPQLQPVEEKDAAG